MGAFRANVALSGLLAAAACSQERPLPGASRVSWQEDVAPLFQERCVQCHSGATPAKGYDASAYLSAIGPKDAPVATAGDASSLLLRTIDPTQADATHAGVTDIYPTVRAWVVDGRLSFFRSGVHEGGILNPNDPKEFHGAILKSRNWDLNGCGKCHGADFTGGVANVSCTQCHTQGPTACDTCHGQPPASGAHAAHFAGAVGKKLDCSECHVKPAHWDDAGHLTTPDGKAKEKATVTFGAQAALPGPGRTGAPAWDGATCSNVQCHGGAMGDPKATHITPSWNGGAAEASCGSCHGLPPSTHSPGQTQCSACHSQVIGKTGVFNTALHVNGSVQLGDGVGGTCTSCHGSPVDNDPAPPRDLSGNTSESFIGVGAHQAHLEGKQNYGAPVQCSACHQVPTDVNSPGHIDHDPPATVVFSGQATLDGAAPVWDRASASCSTSYCHGGGAAMAGDTAAKLRTPNWTLGSSQAFCGSCHGLPPTTPKHAGITYPDCSRCHANTVTPNGGIIVSGPPGARTSAHLNGVIDVTP